METPAEILEELRRHLLWQWEDGGKWLLRDRLAPQVQFAPIGKAEAPAPVSTPPVRSLPQAPQSTAAAGGSGLSLRDRIIPGRGERARPLEPAAPVESNPTAAHSAPEGSAQVRTLDEVRRELGECTRCQLCQGRKTIVFGTGNPRAELMFVGEGPGAEEDAQGIPFVGQAGELLTKMIVAMGYSRDEVYICNVVKCRPPNNRNPEPGEIKACEPFLKAQIAAVRPKAIVALGKFASQTLLKDPTSITRLRGQWRRYEGIPLMPTFHPAYLLRTPAAKKDAWTDLQQVMAALKKSGQG